MYRLNDFAPPGPQVGPSTRELKVRTVSRIGASGFSFVKMSCLEVEVEELGPVIIERMTPMIVMADIALMHHLKMVIL